MPSATSTRTTSPSSFCPAISASVPPICPAPTRAIFFRAIWESPFFGGEICFRPDCILRQGVEILLLNFLLLQHIFQLPDGQFLQIRLFGVGGGLKYDFGSGDGV